MYVFICSKMGTYNIWLRKTKCFGGVIIKVCIWVKKKHFLYVQNWDRKVFLSVRLMFYWLFP